MYGNCVEPWNGPWNENLEAATSTLKRDRSSVGHLHEVHERSEKDPFAQVTELKDHLEMCTCVFSWGQTSLWSWLFICLAVNLQLLNPGLVPDSSTAKCCRPWRQWQTFVGTATGEFSRPRLCERWAFDWRRKTKSRKASVKHVYTSANTVSSKNLKPTALKEGFHCEETLAGFKWMTGRQLTEGKAQGFLSQGNMFLLSFLFNFIFIVSV